MLADDAGNGLDASPISGQHQRPNHDRRGLTDGRARRLDRPRCEGRCRGSPRRGAVSIAAHVERHCAKACLRDRPTGPGFSGVGKAVAEHDGGTLPCSITRERRSVRLHLRSTHRARAGRLGRWL